MVDVWSSVMLIKCAIAIIRVRELHYNTAWGSNSENAHLVLASEFLHKQQLVVVANQYIFKRKIIFQISLHYVTKVLATELSLDALMIL